MNSKQEISKKFWIILLSVCLFLIIVVAIAFAAFSNRKPVVLEKEEDGGNVVLNYSSDVSGLRLLNAVPTTDAIAMKKMDEGEFFDFSVDVLLNEAPSIEYEISIKKDLNYSTISDDDIRIYLEQEKSGTYSNVFGPDKYTALKQASSLGTKSGSMVLLKVKRKKSTTDHYRLRVWLSDKSLVTSGNYSVEISVVGVAK